MRIDYLASLWLWLYKCLPPPLPVSKRWLQHTAAHCTALQLAVTQCNRPHPQSHTPVKGACVWGSLCNTVQHSAEHSATALTLCNTVLQHSATALTLYNTVLQHSATALTLCNTMLQHSATALTPNRLKVCAWGAVFVFVPLTCVCVCVCIFVCVRPCMMYREWVCVRPSLMYRESVCVRPCMMYR